MSNSDLKTNLVDQFNNLNKKFGASMLDYIATKSITALYSYQNYTRNLYFSQHPDSFNGDNSTSVRCFKDVRIASTEHSWDLEMVAKVEELILDFGLEVFRYGFSCYIAQLCHIEAEHSCYSDYEEHENEYNGEEFDIDPLHYL